MRICNVGVFQTPIYIVTPTRNIINVNAPSPGLFNISQNPKPGAGYNNTSSDNETFQQFRASHPGMTYAEALHAWKAKKRGKHLSAPKAIDSGDPYL